MPKRAFRTRRLAVLFGLALLAAAGALHAILGDAGVSHLEKSDCAQCHLGGKTTTPQQANILVASQEALCGKCHPGSIQVSHPTGFAPKAKPPAGFPLDWKGDLTCSTCHDVHSSGRGLMRSTLAGKQLCSACHSAEFFSAMRDGGASLTSGHLLAKGVDSNAPLLDAYSRKCLECHGTNANPKLATSVDRNGVVRHAGQQVNHPIGMSYQKSAAFGGYRKQKEVERKLLLPDGKLSCVSCHAGFQKEHGRLQLGMSLSKLCYECHNL